ncbi:MAG TPA: hypothetical protein VNI01_06080, partial [Elusimicrobiota bacterium]|nr:hypothetical protein [Elusimicrobiota bacterium]
CLVPSTLPIQMEGFTDFKTAKSSVCDFEWKKQPESVKQNKNALRCKLFFITPCPSGPDICRRRTKPTPLRLQAQVQDSCLATQRL